MLAQKFRRKLSTLLILLPFLLLILGGIYFLYTYYSIDLTRQLEEPSIILDREGKQVSRYSS